MKSLNYKLRNFIVSSLNSLCPLRQGRAKMRDDKMPPWKSWKDVSFGQCHCRRPVGGGSATQLLVLLSFPPLSFFKATSEALTSSSGNSWKAGWVTVEGQWQALPASLLLMWLFCVWEEAGCRWKGRETSWSQQRAWSQVLSHLWEVVLEAQQTQ